MCVIESPPSEDEYYGPTANWDSYRVPKPHDSVEQVQDSELWDPREDILHVLEIYQWTRSLSKPAEFKRVLRDVPGVSKVIPDLPNVGGMIVVFGNPSEARSALCSFKSPFLKLRPIDDSVDARNLAKKVPKPMRKPTNTTVAKRLIYGELGLAPVRKTVKEAQVEHTRKLSKQGLKPKIMKRSVVKKNKDAY